MAPVPSQGGVVSEWYLRQAQDSPQANRQGQVLRAAVPSPRQPSPGRGTKRAKNKPRRIAGVLAGAFVLLLIIVVIAIGGGNAKPAGSASAAATVTSAHPASAAASSSAKPSFPPKTLSAFMAFAATGDASQVTRVASSTVGLATCPQPSVDVIVSSGLSDRTLAADLSAFFVQAGFTNNQCGAVVFAYHSESDYQANQNDGFTAGRVITTANGSQLNLEVDTGAATAEQSEFDFNF